MPMSFIMSRNVEHNNNNNNNNDNNNNNNNKFIVYIAQTSLCAYDQKHITSKIINKNYKNKMIKIYKISIGLNKKQI